jgi:hypothetical protein
MTWWDGFVIALANSAFLIAALAGSIGVLGTAGAVVLWTISVLVGALQINIYAELATMLEHRDAARLVLEGGDRANEGGVAAPGPRGRCRPRGR